MMNKRIGSAVFLIIIVCIAGVITIQQKTQRESSYLLNAVIENICESNNTPNIKIEYIDGSDLSGISKEYTILSRDYTFGMHEFRIQFRDDSEYYFEITKNKNIISAGIKRLNPKDLPTSQ